MSELMCDEITSFNPLRSLSLGSEAIYNIPKSLGGNMLVRRIEGVVVRKLKCLASRNERGS